jgi:hypothetical protein
MARVSPLEFQLVVIALIDEIMTEWVALKDFRIVYRYNQG